MEKIRQRLVERGFRETLDGAKRDKPLTEKLLNGKRQAQVIVLCLGPPPAGSANWSLRLLARKVVELEVVEAIGRDRSRRTSCPAGPSAHASPPPGTGRQAE
ncbi:MAG: hypothetical protein H0T47_09370 [Planctomycetaceae bacterium]|nr:hypothetical protein [Planctomycetaceae bacterium]